VWMLTRLRRRQTNPRRWEAGCWAPPAAVAVLPAAVAAAATALVSAARRAVPLCSAEFPHLNLTSYRSPAARPCGAKTGQNPMLQAFYFKLRVECVPSVPNDGSSRSGDDQQKEGGVDAGG